MKWPTFFAEVLLGSSTPCVAGAFFPEVQFLVPDWGMKVGQGVGTGPPTYVRSLADHCDNLTP